MNDFMRMMALMNPEAMYHINERLDRMGGNNKPSRKCGLPGCERTTQHNGGYCCAEHCKEDRERLKKEVKL